LSLLRGPPSALIVIEPGIQVKSVIDGAATKLDAGDIQGVEQRDADSKICSRLRLTEAPNDRKAKGLWREFTFVFHGH